LARSWQSSYILKIFATIREVKRYRARYYDPTTQRFLSQDPIRFVSGDFNFYRYVFNSPTYFTDPNGEISLGQGVIWIVITIIKLSHWHVPPKIPDKIPKFPIEKPRKKGKPNKDYCDK